MKQKSEITDWWGGSQIIPWSVFFFFSQSSSTENDCFKMPLAPFSLLRCDFLFLKNKNIISDYPASFYSSRKNKKKQYSVSQTALPLSPSLAQREKIRQRNIIFPQRKNVSQEKYIFMKKMFIFSDCIATFSPHGSGTPMHLRPLRLIYDEYHQK